MGSLSRGSLSRVSGTKQGVIVSKGGKGHRRERKGTSQREERYEEASSTGKCYVQ